MSDNCHLTICSTPSGYLFRIAGRGTMRESPAVRDFICGAIEDGAQVVLDLSQCEYLDSTFLGCLVLLKQRGDAGRGSFAVLADEPARDRLLASVQLHRVLPFTDRCPPCEGEPVTLHVSPLERREFCRHLEETHRRLAQLGGPAAATFQSIADELAHQLDA